MDSIAFTQERMKRQFDDLQDKTQVWFYAQSKHPVLHKETYDLKISFLAIFHPSAGLMILLDSLIDEWWYQTWARIRWKDVFTWVESSPKKHFSGPGKPFWTKFVKSNWNCEPSWFCASTCNPSLSFWTWQLNHSTQTLLNSQLSQKPILRPCRFVPNRSMSNYQLCDGLLDKLYILGGRNASDMCLDRKQKQL